MEWVEDSFLQLLNSPVWKCHVGNFIDENCLIFDSEEENKFPYTDVHTNYKKMIDDMLKEYLSDFGITLDHLMEACSSALATKHQDVFKHLLAVEDFLLFKSIMVKRNTELNKEAMALMQRSEDHYTKQSNERGNDNTLTQISETGKQASQTNLSSQTSWTSVQSSQTGKMSVKTSQADNKTEPKHPVKSEHQILEEALLKSIADFEEKRENDFDEEKQFEELIQKAMEESMKTYKEETQGTSKKMGGTADGRSKLNTERQRQRVADNERTAETKSQKDLELPKEASKRLEEKDQEDKEEQKDEDIKLKAESGAEAATQWLELARAKNEVQEQPRPSKLNGGNTKRSDPSEGHDVKQREIYLKKQRDKIIEMKKKEREKQLNKRFKAT